jgi:hypothetical protein
MLGLIEVPEIVYRWIDPFLRGPLPLPRGEQVVIRKFRPLTISY